MLPILMENEVLRSFTFWTGILVLKMLAMSALTGVYRFKNMSFANEEDTKILPNAVVNLADEQVERVRRGHLNDLENVVPLIIIGFAYALIDPPVTLAIYLFRVAVGCRIAHTIVYTIIVVPQPARLIAFVVPALISVYMAVEVVRTMW